MRNTNKIQLMETERLQNIVGALALTIADEIAEKTENFAPRDDPVAAIAVIGRSPNWTIRQLSNDLRLSHAATVRLVDRLVADDLMRRTKSTRDARAVELILTANGQHVYAEVLQARQASLKRLLSSLSHHEQDALGKIAEKLLSAGSNDKARRSRTCRLCDVVRCRTCPMDIADASLSL